MGRKHTEETKTRLREASLDYWSDNAAMAAARGERMRAGKVKAQKACVRCASEFVGFGQARYCDSCRVYLKRALGLKPYGITPEEYDELFESQGGSCAICEQPHGGSRSTSLRVDHCHDTGQVRGLLCDSCNLGLGKMRDDPDRLRKAADYIENTTTTTAVTTKEKHNG